MNCGYYPDSMSNSEYESEFGDDSGIPGLGYSGSEDDCVELDDAAIEVEAARIKQAVWDSICGKVGR